MALATFEPVSLNTGRLFERANASERNTQNFAISNSEIGKEVFNLESSSQCTVEQPRNQLAEMDVVFSCSSLPTDTMLWINSKK